MHQKQWCWTAAQENLRLQNMRKSGGRRLYVLRHFKLNTPGQDGLSDLHLRQPLGKWIKRSNQQWQFYYDPKRKSLIMMVGNKVEGTHLQKAAGTRKNRTKTFQHRDGMHCILWDEQNLIPSDGKVVEDILQSTFSLTQWEPQEKTVGMFSTHKEHIRGATVWWNVEHVGSILKAI